MSAKWSGSRRWAGSIAAAAVLASVAVAGCGGDPPLTGDSSGDPIAGAGSAAVGSADPGSPGAGSPSGGALAAAPGSTCYQWSGLQALNGIALPLQMMASDEMADASSDQLAGDSLAVRTALDGFQGKVQELPSSYAQAVQNEVIWVALNSISVSTDQLNTAAEDAQYLAGQISHLCISSPS